MTSTRPKPPTGPYPQAALCGHQGPLPKSMRIRTMMRIVASIVLPRHVVPWRRVFMVVLAPHLALTPPLLPLTPLMSLVPAPARRAFPTPADRMAMWLGTRRRRHRERAEYCTE